VTTLFLDSPILDDVYDIRLTDSAESVGDGDCRPALRRICESLVHLKLGRRIECRSRLCGTNVVLAVLCTGIATSRMDNLPSRNKISGFLIRALAIQSRWSKDPSN
jgi:hypothetical protein